MKRLSWPLGLLAGGAVALLGGCDDDYSRPPHRSPQTHYHMGGNGNGGLSWEMPTTDDYNPLSDSPDGNQSPRALATPTPEPVTLALGIVGMVVIGMYGIKKTR